MQSVDHFYRIHHTHSIYKSDIFEMEWGFNDDDEDDNRYVFETATHTNLQHVL